MIYTNIIFSLKCLDKEILALEDRLKQKSRECNEKDLMLKINQDSLRQQQTVQSDLESLHKKFGKILLLTLTTPILIIFFNQIIR